MSWHQEGQVRFQVGSAFYRPTSQLARDLGVLAAAIAQQNHGQLRVLDVTTGCGVRALRYGVESQATWIWANDANPEVAATLSQNLAPLGSGVRTTHWSANQVFFDCHQRQDYYDLVDLDNFGSPAAHLSACLQATRLGGLIYLTSTDSRNVAGHDPEASLRHYGAYARSHPAAQEQGLRLLIGAVLQQAMMQGWTVQPIFSLFQGQIYRVMVQLTTQPAVLEHQGFLGHCHACGHYQTVGWRGLSRAHCPAHAIPEPLTLSGPMWLGSLHDLSWLERMTRLAQAWDWSTRVTLLRLMQAEAELPPYFFTLAEIGRRGKMDIPGRDLLIQTLQAQGYVASPTHIDPQAIKTTAPFETCLQIAKQLGIRTPD